jgi:hypothetical protein
MSARLPKLLVGLALACWPLAAQANIIAELDGKAIAVIAKTSPTPFSQREAALVNLAMFDAVNAIDRRYQPYVMAPTAVPAASREAAAAAAAAATLAALHPEAAADIKAMLAASLAALPDDDARQQGVKLGETAAAKVLEARRNDGATAPDSYRPKTKLGAYVPTTITVGSAWPAMTPFALAKPAQFRPAPPPALDSKEWIADYNEIRLLGAKASATRTPQQTETARFWLATGPTLYHQVARQVIKAQNLDVVDSARFMALVGTALADAYIAVYDAKYAYEFWRPITAIRNGDTEANATTPREATWQPIDTTPMHPEYPCAHCINAAAAAAVIEALIGSKTIPEVAIVSSTAPGVTHRFTHLDALCEEVAQARIWAGFHYRTSTVVGNEMGRRVGENTVQKLLQPLSGPALMSVK